MKATKRIIAIALALAFVVAMAAGCAKKEAEAGGVVTATLWASGSDNTRQSIQAVIDAFHKTEAGQKYNVKLEFIGSGTGAEDLDTRLAAAKQSGQTNTEFDMIEVADDAMVNYRDRCGEDIFVKVDWDKLQNDENLVTKSQYVGDDGTPYRVTTVVLAYNSEKVPEPPKTAEELYQWIRDNPGRFTYNPPNTGGAGSSFVRTVVYNFLPAEAEVSSDEKWKEQWNQGFDLLTELHPYMYKSGGTIVYPNKNQGAMDLLANGEVDMIPAWADMMITQIKAGTMPDYMKISTITPSFTGNIVNFCITSIGNPDHRDACLAFMDFAMSPEAQNILLDVMAAVPVIKPELLDENLKKTVEAIDLSTFRVMSIGTLSKDNANRWDEQIATLPTP